VVFFFFQAEDGIRCLTVTGVQTCALPICNQYPNTTIGEVAHQYLDIADRDGIDAGEWFIEQHVIRAACQGPGNFDTATLATRQRSEERRVGKECRSRWGEDH